MFTKSNWVHVFLGSRPVLSSLAALAAEVVSSLVFPGVSPLPSHSWISSVLRHKKQTNRNNHKNRFFYGPTLIHSYEVHC